MNKIIFVSPRQCTGCGQCEIACALFKKNPSGPNTSCIRIESLLKGSLSYPILCTQCEEAKCLLACPSGAIKRNEETGIVVLNEDRCVGCKMCILACPFGCITFQENQRKALKCDLCSGDPQCIQFCPTNALILCEKGELSLLRSTVISDKFASVLRKSD